jgi:hypothetical protein
MSTLCVACRVLLAAAQDLLVVLVPGHHKEHDMPNRGELAKPIAHAAKAAAAADDAWTVIGFCAIGWLLSIYMAVSTLGFDAVPKLMAQFPGIM